MKFEVKATEHTKDFYIYLSCSMNKVNPIEVEKDLEIIKNYLLEKYTEDSKIKKEESFKSFLTNLLGLKQKD